MYSQKSAGAFRGAFAARRAGNVSIDADYASKQWERRWQSKPRLTALCIMV